MNPEPNTPHVVFERSPVPGVPLDVIRHLLTLPDEVRTWLGNFLLDSAVEKFDGAPETSARLWKDELTHRIEDAKAHPEKLMTAEESLRRLREHVEQLRRTPHPHNMVGYNCVEYFAGGWAEKGHYDEAAQYWVISPLNDLNPEHRLGFFAVGRAGVDGVLFGYRYGHRGLWAFYPSTQEFRLLAPTIAALVEGWRSGAITV